MVTSRHTNNAYLSPFFCEIIDLLQHPNRETSITRVYREANRSADFLANMGHSSSFDGDIVNLACHSLQLILYDDFFTSFDSLILFPSLKNILTNIMDW
jgi:molybdopterin biosynthesis enzyme